MTDVGDLDVLLAEAGFATRLLPPVVERADATLARAIDGLEAGQQSACWELSEATRRDAAEATRAWARNQFGSLDASFERERTITWRAYDAPAS
jgi:hypothetical protein